MLLWILLNVTAWADELHGTVTKVSDGDTITVEDSSAESHKIRLAQIDAPEKKQDFGSVARVELASLILGKEVEVQYTKVDRYGRVLGQVYLDQLDVNYWLVSKGYAWVYLDYPHTVEYMKAQADAHDNKRGLWSDKAPLAPWVWRKIAKNQAKVEAE